MKSKTTVGGLTDLTVPFAGTVLRVAVSPGDRVEAGAVLLLLESMKMEHVVEARAPGTVASIAVTVGDAVQAGDALLSMDEDEDGVGDTASHGPAAVVAERPRSGDEVRPELVELRARVDADMQSPPRNTQVDRALFRRVWSWLDRPLSGAWCALGWLASTALFVGFVALLGGPSKGDSEFAVGPGAAIAHGQLTCAFPRSGPWVAPLYPLVSGAVAATTRIGHSVAFPSGAALGPACAKAQSAFHAWLVSADALSDTLPLGMSPGSRSWRGSWRFSGRQVGVDGSGSRSP